MGTMCPVLAPELGDLTEYPEGKTPIGNAGLPDLAMESHEEDSASCSSGLVLCSHGA